MNFMNVFLRRFRVECVPQHHFALKTRFFSVTLCVKWLTKWGKLGF